MPSMANLLSFSPPSSRPLSLSLRRTPVPTPRLLTVSASSLPIPPPPPSSLLLTSSTRTLTALLSSSASAAAPPHLLFARVPHPPVLLRIPARRIILTLIRAAIKWLSLYVLMMEAKLLLSLIPDIPWLHTPLAAFRSVLDYLCHPFLSIVSARACADPDLRLILVIDLFLSLRWLLAHALSSLL